MADIRFIGRDRYVRVGDRWHKYEWPGCGWTAEGASISDVEMKERSDG